MGIGHACMGWTSEADFLAAYVLLNHDDSIVTVAVPVNKSDNKANSRHYGDRTCLHGILIGHEDMLAWNRTSEAVFLAAHVLTIVTVAAYYLHSL